MRLERAGERARSEAARCAVRDRILHDPQQLEVAQVARHVVCCDSVRAFLREVRSVVGRHCFADVDDELFELRLVNQRREQWVVTRRLWLIDNERRRALLIAVSRARHLVDHLVRYDRCAGGEGILRIALRSEERDEGFQVARRPLDR